MKKIRVAILFFLSIGTIYAGGYRVGVQGQRALAMGHTGVAVVNTAELVFFNPAGLVYLENRINGSVGGSAVFSDVLFQNEDLGIASQNERQIGTPFSLYGSYRINERISVGLGVYTPYGSEVVWPTDWAGSHLVNNTDLAAIYVQPVISVKLSDHFSIGGGPMFVTGSVSFDRNASRTLTDIDGNRSNIAIEDSGVTSWGWSVGAMFTPVEQLRIGVNYRSKVILKAEDGEATFSNFPNSPLSPQNGTTTFSADLPLPAELSLGASYKLNEKWLFALEYNRQFWSVYESLSVEFGNGTSSSSVRNYQNSSVFRFGFEYKATEKIALRGGYYKDESPIPSGFFSPETPRNDADAFTGGFSVAITDKLAIDASFAYLRFAEVNESYDFAVDPVTGAETSFGGTYKSSAFTPGIGLTFKM